MQPLLHDAIEGEGYIVVHLAWNSMVSEMYPQPAPIYISAHGPHSGHQSKVLEFFWMQLMRQCMDVRRQNFQLPFHGSQGILLV